MDTGKQRVTGMCASSRSGDKKERSERDKRQEAGEKKRKTWKKDT
jgi:hypothetical protein